MNRIGEPITFIPHGKENPSDSSFLSDGEVYEINTTYGFISNYLETRNSKKINNIFTKESDIMIHQKHYLQKTLKDSFKTEFFINNMEISGFCLKKPNHLQIKDKNVTESIIKINDDVSKLFPIKLMNPLKKQKPQISLDSNIKKAKNNFEILSGMLNDGSKNNMRIKDNVKNIVLSNLTFQDQNTEKSDKKIFPLNSKITKFQKTVKIFDEIK